ncbi:MAG TPA: YciI family protein [Actinotalea sp.]|nr:YciI family protein [Actinotalea sp.]
MKYLVLIHANQAVGELFAGMSDADRAAAFQIYWDVVSDLRASGELVDSSALDTPEQRLVTRGPDGPVLTDAPLPELTEVVSGYYLVDVSDEARAAQIAARFPEAAVPGGIKIARVWTDADYAAMGAAPQA